MLIYAYINTRIKERNSGQFEGQMPIRDSNAIPVVLAISNLDVEGPEKAWKLLNNIG
jgi:hypothetical protein